MATQKLIIKHLGGLGNQMFQYAFGKAYSYKTGINVMFDTFAIKHKEEQISEYTKREYGLDAYKLSLQEYNINFWKKGALYYKTKN